jgi:hypothetical protein
MWITLHHVQPVPIILSLTQLKEMDSKKGRHRQSASAETQVLPGVISLSTSRQAIRAFRLWKPIADKIKHAPKVGTIPISIKIKQLLDRANKARRHW